MAMQQTDLVLSVARWTAIAAAFVNLGIHLALTPMHLMEMPYIGVLFVIGSALLGAVMVGLASDHNSLRTLAWIGGSVVCVVEFALFVISRTSGLPSGYHETWATSTEDILGLVSLAVEAIFIACAALSLAPAAREPIRPRPVSWMPWEDRTASLP